MLKIRFFVALFLVTSMGSTAFAESDCTKEKAIEVARKDAAVVALCTSSPEKPVECTFTVKHPSAIMMVIQNESMTMPWLVTATTDKGQSVLTKVSSKCEIIAQK